MLKRATFQRLPTPTENMSEERWGGDWRDVEGGKTVDACGRLILQTAAISVSRVSDEITLDTGYENP